MRLKISKEILRFLQDGHVWTDGHENTYFFVPFIFGISREEYKQNKDEYIIEQVTTNDLGDYFDDFITGMIKDYNEKRKLKELVEQLKGMINDGKRFKS